MIPEVPGYVGLGTKNQIERPSGDYFPVAESAAVERLAIERRRLDIDVIRGIVLGGDDEAGAPGIFRVELHCHLVEERGEDSNRGSPGQAGCRPLAARMNQADIWPTSSSLPSPVLGNPCASRPDE